MERKKKASVPNFDWNMKVSYLYEPTLPTIAALSGSQMEFVALIQNLLEFKAINVEKQHRIFVEPWSDSVHIALWRNDEFLSLVHTYG